MRNVNLNTTNSLPISVFEVAARTLSFTLAAKELNITQPAVSQAIKRLELTLGVDLFARSHRKVVLTPAGQQFYEDVSVSLMRIKSSAELLMRSDSSRVTIAASGAFANYWLASRLALFRQIHPDFNLRIQTDNRDLDLEQYDASLVVRRGRGDWPGYDGVQLAREEILPVASPKYIGNHPSPINAQSLIGFNLIHLDDVANNHPNWRNWFKFYGLDYTDTGNGIHYDDYSLVVQGAIAGEGIALGWRHIVRELIEKHVLAPVIDATYHGDYGFWLIWPKDRVLSIATIKLRDWLSKHIAETN